MYVQNMLFFICVLQLIMNMNSNTYEHGWMLTNVNECQQMKFIHNY
jgi:hypothetical protein